MARRADQGPFKNGRAPADTSLQGVVAITIKSKRQRAADQRLASQGVLILAVIAGVVMWSKTGILQGVAVFVAATLFLEFLLVIPAILRRRRLGRAGMNVLDSLDGRGFEEWLRAHFTTMGYKVSLTPAVGDYGGDLILERGDERTVVQAKHWRHQSVGVKAVQEVVAAKGYFRAHRAMVVISGSFTKQAIELAKANGVVLWDRDKLARRIASSPPSDQGSRGKPVAQESPVPQVAGRQVTRPQAQAPQAPGPQAAPAPSTVAASPLCPLCGGPMVRRTSRYGPFWGCPDYLRCEGKRPFRADTRPPAHAPQW